MKRVRVDARLLQQEAAVIFMHRALAAITAHVPIWRISDVTVDLSPEGHSSFEL